MALTKSLSDCQFYLSFTESATSSASFSGGGAAKIIKISGNFNCRDGRDVKRKGSDSLSLNRCFCLLLNIIFIILDIILK